MTTFIFIACLLLFAAIGIGSSRFKKNSTTDYLLAGRGVNPWFIALSALSTSQSVFLFTGQVGYAYAEGLSSIWLAIGWAVGDYMAWVVAFRRIREVTEKQQINSISGLLAVDGRYCKVARASASIIIIFLSIYAAAQLLAGGKALHSMFGWDYSTGIIVGSIIVVCYCFSGGIRASIWTDAAQTIVMIGALLLILTVSLYHIGGAGALLPKLSQQSPELVALLPDSLMFGFGAFFIGWIVAGFGAIGQPHILVRAMAIDSADNIAKARNIRAVCGIITAFSAIAIGLSARILLPELDDPELAMLNLSELYLPEALTGLVMAGLFAAIISTADSQILSCSAAITQHIIPNISKSVIAAKTATLCLSVFICCIALLNNDSIFSLITFSWSALASALGIVILLRLWDRKLGALETLCIMVSGLAVACSWRSLGYASSLYEVLPGMAAATGMYGVILLVRKRRLVLH